MRSRADSKAVITGGETLLGQVATIIENLHLSWREVVYEIPYKTLLIMQKDKVQFQNGVVVKKTSGKEMAARRMQGRMKKENNSKTA